MKPTDTMPDGEAGPLDTPDDAGELHALLWKAVDKLRGHVDAAEYRELVLGVFFLRYVSDAFDRRRAELARELASDGVSEDGFDVFLEDPDAYVSARVLWVPETARWSWITSHIGSRHLVAVLDGAMAAIMRENAPLEGALPRVFRRGVDARSLAGLVQVLDEAQFAGTEGRPPVDMIAEVYGYFLDNFAHTEARRGGEFHTPRSVNRLIVELLEPFEGRLYDPACGVGGTLVEAARFVETRHGRAHTGDLMVYGQEVNQRTWRLARMNLAVHGVEGDLGTRWGDTLADDRHPDLEADFVMSVPPFNMADWARNDADPRWRYGVPSLADANYAWLQHALAKLRPHGTAGVVLANGSLYSKSGGRIRQAMLEDDIVACVVALPRQLFHSTRIPACLWILTKDKGRQSARALADRRGEILFVDARETGALVNRTERVLTETDLGSIVGTYHAWRGTPSAQATRAAYRDEPGFCVSVGLETVRDHEYVLTPSRYVALSSADTTLQDDRRGELKELARNLDTLFD
ncbi:N-6 DNA methylase [Streptomyces sp. NPDC006678]|uniref:type I restriction-modification system subunit M n=1 Tax=Streptomyces sp. NPDC006678 TaxID=3157185 RepID=UPI0033E47AB3